MALMARMEMQQMDQDGKGSMEGEGMGALGGAGYFGGGGGRGDEILLPGAGRADGVAPMAIYGSLATVRAQLAPHPFFMTAFAYLEEFLKPGSEAHQRVMAVGAGETVRTELGGEMFAMEQAYVTKARDDGKLESHRKYIDIQMMVAGVETMEVVDIARLKLKEDLTPGKDVIFYHDTRETSVLRMDQPGMTAVFFPVDGHAGSLALGAPALARKIVVKVPVH